ncbi:related to Oxidoreductase [Melanopsichium pennsylvanicum]|uniref:Related to Oxidoreductase n=2 Tax=Melanopsichium pennsylvanicum TaxID=63383 RepID=A0AAJ4XIA2_9BASI|nr:related to Oxidoreductase [Melanopsichium pennsylvanicum 4]SNX82542.1 related to Oxidoreductase [Melanopsichium pennsylvanicum]
MASTAVPSASEPLAGLHTTNDVSPSKISTQQSLSSLPDYHLDYSLWEPHEPNSISSRQFVSSLRRAMVGVGFFYLHNTPLSTKRSVMFDLVSRFFALPLEDRLAIDMDKSHHFRGYCKFGDERTLAKQDLRDQVDYGPEVKAIADKELVEKWPFLNLYGPNQFVQDSICDGHRSIVLDWFATAECISNELTRAIELALGVDEGELAQYLTGKSSAERKQNVAPDPTLERLGPLPYARMKTIRYPTGRTVDGITRTDPNSTQGVGAHKDSGWLTLLAPSAEVGGLEAQDFYGYWLSVPHVDGSIIVNFGQQVEFLTNGIVQAATHRVISNPSGTKDRYSVAFFSSPALNSFLEPLDSTRFSRELVEEWKSAEEKRGGKGSVKSDVPKGDLWGRRGEAFGWINWRGLVRSHPGVVAAFYHHLCESALSS